MNGTNELDTRSRSICKSMVPRYREKISDGTANRRLRLPPCSREGGRDRRVARVCFVRPADGGASLQGMGSLCIGQMPPPIYRECLLIMTRTDKNAAWCLLVLSVALCGFASAGEVIVGTLGSKLLVLAAAGVMPCAFLHMIATPSPAKETWSDAPQCLVCGGSHQTRSERIANLSHRQITKVD